MFVSFPLLGGMSISNLLHFQRDLHRDVDILECWITAIADIYVP